jgi:hypothetical protein
VKDDGAHASIDRRKYPRVRTDSLVSIRRIETPPPALAHALDLSLGGIRFQCVGVELELGEVVSVTLTLGDRTATVVGKLVRVTDLDAFTQEVALAFLVADDATQALLRETLPDAQEFDPRDQ